MVVAAAAAGTGIAAPSRTSGPGQLDTRFAGGTGVLIDRLTSRHSSSTLVGSVFSGRNGSVVVAGAHGNGSRDGLFALRVLRDGSRDMRFGRDGLVVVDPAPGGVLTGVLGPGGELPGGYGTVPWRETWQWDRTPTALGFDDGSLLLSGLLYPSRGPRTAVFVAARLRPDGSLDPNFGDGGRVTVIAATSGWPGERTFHIGTVATSNRITVVWTHAACAPAVCVRAGGTVGMLGLHSDGTVDTAFGIQGFAYHPVPEAWACFPKVEVDGAGRIVMSCSGVDGMVRRFLPDGTPDATFGVAGLALVDTGGVDVGNALAVTPEGRIAIGGTTMSYADRAKDSVYLARLDSNGSLEQAFGAGGLAMHTVDRAEVVDMSSDNGVIHTVTKRSFTDYFVLAVDPSGRAFGESVRLPGHPAAIAGIAVEPDRVLVVGRMDRKVADVFGELPRAQDVVIYAIRR